MLYSLDWLAEYVDLPPETATVADRLTSIGFAVEGIESRDGQKAHFVWINRSVSHEYLVSTCHFGRVSGAG